MSPTLEIPTHHGHQPPHVSNRLRSGMRKLLPFTKTATFLVRVTIHDVTNVPLMNGRFSVRWKFRGGRGGEVTERSYSSSEHLPQNITLTRASTDDALAAHHFPHPSPTPSSISSLITSPPSSVTITPHSADTIRTPIPNASFPPPPHSSPNPYSTFASSPLAPRSATMKKASMDSTSMSISTQSSMSRASTADSLPSPVVGLFSDNALQRSESPDRLSATSGPSVSDSESARAGGEGGQMSRDASSNDLSGRGRLHDIMHRDKPSRSDSFSARWKGKGKATERSPNLENNVQKSGPRADDHQGDASRKGHTPVRDLKDHACSWDYDLVQTVRMDIRPIHHSDSSAALNKHGGHHHLDEEARAHAQSIGLLGGGLKSESGLKLTILQNVEVGKTHHKEGEPLHAAQQFGVVNLNLAEYACEEARMGKGGITRRYLLKEGKTNATIRLTIDLEQIGGEKEYHTPPLQKGQVVAGLTAFTGLGQNEPLLAPLQNRRKRPESSASSSSIGTMGNLTISASTSSQSLSEKRSMRSLRRGKTIDGTDQRSDPHRHATAGLAESEHPHAHHPHHYHTHRTRHRPRHHHAPTFTTEEVIQGIFNPRPSKEVGPFFVPLDSGIVLNPYDEDGDPEEDGGLQIPLGGKRKDRERRPIANGRLWSTFRHPTRGGMDTPRSGIGPGGTPLGEKRFNWHREASPEKAKRHGGGFQADSSA